MRKAVNLELSLSHPSRSTPLVRIRKELLGGDLALAPRTGGPEAEKMLIDRTGTIAKIAKAIVSHREKAGGLTATDGIAMHDLSCILTLFTPNNLRGRLAHLTFPDFEVSTSLPRIPRLLQYNEEATVTETMKQLARERGIFRKTAKIDFPLTVPVRTLVALSLMRELGHASWFSEFYGTVASPMPDGSVQRVPGYSTGITTTSGLLEDEAAATMIIEPPTSYDRMRLLDDVGAKAHMLILTANEDITALVRSGPRATIAMINETAEKMARMINHAYELDPVTAINFVIQLATADAIQGFFTMMLVPKIEEVVHTAETLLRAGKNLAMREDIETPDAQA